MNPINEPVQAEFVLIIYVRASHTRDVTGEDNNINRSLAGSQLVCNQVCNQVFDLIE